MCLASPEEGGRKGGEKCDRKKEKRKERKKDREVGRRKRKAGSAMGDRDRDRDRCAPKFPCALEKRLLRHCRCSWTSLCAARHGAAHCRGGCGHWHVCGGTSPLSACAWHLAGAGRRLGAHGETVVRSDTVHANGLARVRHWWSGGPFLARQPHSCARLTVSAAPASVLQGPGSLRRQRQRPRPGQEEKPQPGKGQAPQPQQGQEARQPEPPATEEGEGEWVRARVRAGEGW